MRRDGPGSGPTVTGWKSTQLPLYSPELNPTERLWQHTRRTGTRNRYFTSRRRVLTGRSLPRAQQMGSRRSSKQPAKRSSNLSRRSTPRSNNPSAIGTDLSAVKTRRHAPLKMLAKLELDLGTLCLHELLPPVGSNGTPFGVAII